MMTEHDENSWAAWRNLVLDKLDGFEKKFDKVGTDVKSLNDAVTELRLESAVRKGKMAILGSIGGFCAYLGLNAVQYLFKHGAR